MKRFKNSIAVLGSIFFLSCNPATKKEKASRVTTLPYYTDASFTPKWIDPKSTGYAKTHQIPPFMLLNQLGDTITEKLFNDKIYVADFFFTSCPGICPKMTDNMLLIQKEFEEDEDVLLLSHSVTPEYDSVPILKNYAEAKGVISNKWHLVTGKRKEIYDLGRQGYFVEEDLGLPKGKNDFLHTENFVLIDQNRHIRGIYNGLNKTAIAQLIADIKTLKNEM
ncbi:MAG: SCO family protein [Bacteroidota bacterium]